jgi:hypothetical protein
VFRVKPGERKNTGSDSRICRARVRVLRVPGLGFRILGFRV